MWTRRGAPRFSIIMFVAVAALATSGQAAAAPGDVVTDLAPPGVTDGVSVAFDGKRLHYTAQNGLSLHSVAPDGTGHVEKLVVGAAGINAIAYDAALDRFWAVDSTGLNVFTLDREGMATLQFVINPLTDLPGGCGQLLGCDSVVAGLAFDMVDDSLWYLPARSNRIYHFNTAGHPLGYVDLALTPECAANEGFGVAAGETALYVTAGACGKVFRLAKDGTRLGVLSSTGVMTADAECDDVTFMVDVVWVRDGEDGRIRALEIPSGTCIYGGGQSLDHVKQWMTGGGPIPLPGLFIRNGETTETEITIAFHGNCPVAGTVPDTGNNLTMKWRADNQTFTVHVGDFVIAECDTAGGDPTPPPATFNRHRGTATGSFSDGRGRPHRNGASVTWEEFADRNDDRNEGVPRQDTTILEVELTDGNGASVGVLVVNCGANQWQAHSVPQSS